MNIHESAEDYLEAILRLKLEKGYSRSVDISTMLGVSKPSVSFAMKRFRENGYIEMDDDSLITLTDKGMEIAERIYERHRVLSMLLEDIGVSPEQAREDACKIEHDISDETFGMLKQVCARLEAKKAER